MRRYGTNHALSFGHAETAVANWHMCAHPCLRYYDISCATSLAFTRPTRSTNCNRRATWMHFLPRPLCARMIAHDKARQSLHFRETKFKVRFRNLMLKLNAQELSLQFTICLVCPAIKICLAAGRSWQHGLVPVIEWSFVGGWFWVAMRESGWRLT